MSAKLSILLMNTKDRAHFVSFSRLFLKWKKWPMCLFEEKLEKTCLSEFIFLNLRLVFTKTVLRMT